MNRKKAAILVVSAIILIVGSVSSEASGDFSFKNNLVWGMKDSPDVAVMQQFLANQNLYSGPITGNFFSLTYQGLVKFQKKEGIKPSSGFFGPMTRADANIILPSIAGYDEIINLSGFLKTNNETISNPRVVSSTNSINGGYYNSSPIFSGSSAQSSNSGGGSGNSSLGGMDSVKIIDPPLVQATTTQEIIDQATTSQATTTLPVDNLNSINGMLWGAYVGENINDLNAFESLVGKEVDIQAVFVGWNDDFPITIANNLKSKNKTLLIFWEQNGITLDDIIAGKSDSYIISFSKEAKNYGGSIILAPLHEMNGNWDSWDGTVGNNSSQKIIDAWRHIYNTFGNDLNVKFAWDVNNDSVPDTTENTIDVYYPGNAYVDYVGVDGFNFSSPWQSFDSVFSKTLNRLETYNKPIYIFSIASAEAEAKASWITEAFSVEMNKYPIAGWVWFNENKEQNWLVNSDEKALEAFKQIIP